MEIKIRNLKDIQISGVSYCLPEEVPEYTESWFDWKAYPKINDMKTEHVGIGLLTSWHHKPVYDQIEYHEGQELFFFTEGPCVMLFCDIENGEAIMDSAIIARIEKGTELFIDAGKGHFVPVGIENTNFFRAVVVAPPQDAPRIMLPEPIIGVF